MGFDMPMPWENCSQKQVEYTMPKWDSWLPWLSNSEKAQAGAKIEAPVSDQNSERTMSNQNNQPTQITNLGQIAKVELPQGWVEGTPTAGDIGIRSWREVHPESAPDATLCFYYRGRPASDEAGENFSSILQQPPHPLSQSEIKSIGEILRGKDDPSTFTAMMIRTEDLNGKRVLSISGRLSKTQEDLQGIIVDADGTGKIPQEIYFQAPKDLYLRYNKAAKEAIKSIEWK